MANPVVLSLSLCFLVLFNGCLAFRQQSRPQHQLQQQQNQCDISNFEALEPNNRIDCEAGRIESWDTNNEQFQCAGVAMVRYTIESNGLLLPSFSNAPQLMYILQGKGTQGGIAPGCPETYQSFPEQTQIRGQFERGQSFQDQHQKIRKIRQGDIIAMPAGVAHWIYNDGQEELVAVVFYDTTSSANQLDVNPRNFFLAGNPQDEFETQQNPHRSKQSQGSCNNIFCGFDVEMLAEAFNVDTEIAKKLQSPKDGRNNIVKVEGQLQMVKPRWTREEQQQIREEQEQDNGLEETYCSMRIKENIGDPSRADIFTPQAGRLATVNSNNLPILRPMRLSAEKGVLYQNAMMAPHWNLNAHSVIYVSRGRARIQIVDNNGEKVFDEDLTEGQVVTVPQNFAVVKRAESEGFEWVAFKTNDNAMMSTLAGQTSVMRGLPVQVIANAYQISPEQARKLKYNRMETFLFNLESSPRSRTRE